MLPSLMLDTGGRMGEITGLAFTPDGRQLVSASIDKVIRVWDLEATKTVRTIRGQVELGPEGKIFTMALSRDGRWLAAGGWTLAESLDHPGNVVVRLYDFPTGRLVCVVKGHFDVVTGVAFSPDSKLLISGSNVVGWPIISNVKSCKMIRRLHEELTLGADRLAFTPDGERAVTLSHGYVNALGLWRVSDGGLIAEMKGHKNNVNAVAVRSSDGMIASGCVRTTLGASPVLVRKRSTSQ